MIHDLAVNPISKNTYLAVSRGGENWTWEFATPNDIANADVLLKVTPEGEMSVVSLEDIRYSSVALSNPISEDSMFSWKKDVSLRVDAITYLSFHKNKLYVAGLSNEEFASTLRVFNYPFTKELSATSLEVFHGAHGKWETASPVRSFIPFDVDGKPHLLAAYMCTPLATFPVEDLKDGAHVKGRTIAELGYGNFPNDIVKLNKKGQDFLLIANSNRTMMHINVEEIEQYEGSIEEQVGALTGVPYIPLPGGQVTQMDVLDENNIVMVRRGPNGRMNLESRNSNWL